jgi:hypothetical protein
VTIKFQMKNVDEANKILSGMTAIIWNRANKAYMDIKSETLCYPLPQTPKKGGPSSSIFTPQPLLECEALLQYTM